MIKKYCLKNRKSKISLDFEIHINCPIQTRRPDLIIMNKEMKIYHHKKILKICQVMDVAIPEKHREELWVKIWKNI